MKKVASIFLFFALSASALNAESLLYSEGANAGYSLLYGDIGVQRELYGDINNEGTGFGFDVGWNIAGHFDRQMLIAPFVGLSILWGTSYDSGFVGDFKANENTAHSGLSDEHADLLASGRADSAVEFRWGILFQVPVEYVPPMKLYSISYNTGSKTGTSTSYLYSDGSTRSEDDQAFLERSGWGIEALLYSLYRSDGANLGCISVYMHRLDFGSATLEGGDSWKDYQTDQTSAYDDETIIGIRIGLNVF